MMMIKIYINSTTYNVGTTSVLFRKIEKDKIFQSIDKDDNNCILLTFFVDGSVVSDGVGVAWIVKFILFIFFFLHHQHVF